MNPTEGIGMAGEGRMEMERDGRRKGSKCDAGSRKAGGDKLQSHMGSASSLEVELRESWDDLTLNREVPVSKLPLSIDMVIVKRRGSGEIPNEIGRIFRGHNIIEFKSERDALNIDTLLKAYAYACLYENEGSPSDVRAADDITVTLIRDSRPTGLLRYLEAHGCQVTQRYGGIYYVWAALFFPTQIVVGKELDRKRHRWIKMAMEKVSEQDMRDALLYMDGVTDKRERDLLASVMDLCMRRNAEAIRAIKESGNMFEVLRDLFEPEIERIEREADQRVEQVERETTERVERAERETRESQIRLGIKSMRRFHISDDDILSSLTEDYGLSREDALAYLT